jgi:hypothetical protein
MRNSGVGIATQRDTRPTTRRVILDLEEGPIEWGELRMDPESHRTGQGGATPVIDMLPEEFDPSRDEERP